MPTHAEKQVVPYRPDQLFELVADVGRYPEFLPWCVAARVRSRTEAELVADLTIGFGPFRESFTSRVTLDRARLTILVEYLDGPFSRMQNRWTFRQTSEISSDVEFFIDYEFRSRTFAMLAGAVFDTVFRRMAAAFEKRADQVYGRKLA